MPYELLIVDQSNIQHIKTRSAESAILAPGQARLRVESFALTANNITYAAIGHQIGYWRFFPSGVEGWGVVPVWGSAVVSESQADGLAAGTRLYGFLPMAQEWVMQAQADKTGAFIDVAPHRVDLPAIYNRYAPIAGARSQDDDYRALLQPLLATGFLLADWLNDNNWFGARQIIVGSASSKTAIGLCRFLREFEDRPFRIVGLTSHSNTDFVRSAGTCDTVLSYEEIGSLDLVDSVFVDMSGNADVRARLHTHLGDLLRFSSAVGLSHWDKLAPQGDLPGPKPEMFFAPAQAEKRRAEWGAQVLDRKITEAWKRVARSAQDWMILRHHAGLSAAIPVYQSLVGGEANPNDGHIVQIASTTD